MPLKKKIFKDQDLVDYITKSANFKIIIFFTIVTSFYGAYIIGNGINSFFEVIIYSHTSSYYNIMLFSILAINTINTSSMFIKNNDYIIRLGNREKYLKRLVEIVVKVNLLLITISILTFLSILILTKYKYIYIKEYQNYGTSNLIYSIFYLLRYYIYAIIFSIINTLLYERIGEHKVMIIDFIFIILFGLNTVTLIQKSKFSILPWTYFKLNNYTSFNEEIICSFIFLILLEVISIIIFKILMKRKKIFSKYLIYNDLNYLLKKQKKVLLLILIVPIILIIINLNKQLDWTIIISNTLGLTADKNQINSIITIIYFYNIISFLYLSFFYYIKDYQTNLEQVYLRKGFEDFYLHKTLLLLTIILLIKILQYIPLLLVLLITNYSLNFISLLNLFITDYLYILVITQLGISMYLSNIIFKKKRLINLVISIIIILNIPITIINLQEYKNILLLLLIIITVYNNYLNVKYHKRIINEVGGK